MNPVYDIVELKDKIRKLRDERIQIDHDKTIVEDEIKIFESKWNQIKQELNIISNTDDIRGNIPDDENKEEYNPDIIKAFRIFNDKLDMKILNDEIRNILPVLEKEALEWESKATGKLKITNKNDKAQKQFPSMILRSEQEIQDQIGEIMDDCFKIKSKISSDIDTKKKEKLNICNEIATLRRRLTIYDQELEPLESNHMRLKNALLEEQYRIELLKDEHRLVRKAFDMYYHTNNSREVNFNSYLNQNENTGWQSEAFLSIAGRLDGYLQKSQVIQLLDQWILPKKDEAINFDEFLQSFYEINHIIANHEINLKIFQSICNYMVEYVE